MKSTELARETRRCGASWRTSATPRIPPQAAIQIRRGRKEMGDFGLPMHVTDCRLWKRSSAVLRNSHETSSAATIRCSKRRPGGHFRKRRRFSSSPSRRSSATGSSRTATKVAVATLTRATRSLTLTTIITTMRMTERRQALACLSSTPELNPPGGLLAIVTTAEMVVAPYCPHQL